MGPSFIIAMLEELRETAEALPPGDARNRVVRSYNRLRFYVIQTGRSWTALGEQTPFLV